MDKFAATICRDPIACGVYIACIDTVLAIVVYGVETAEIQKAQINEIGFGLFIACVVRGYA